MHVKGSFSILKCEVANIQSFWEGRTVEYSLSLYSYTAMVLALDHGADPTHYLMDSSLNVLLLGSSTLNLLGPTDFEVD